MKLSTIAIVLFLTASLTDRSIAQESYWDETTEARNARMAWWRDARFGMFIHWGLYAIPAGEWEGGKNHAEWIRRTAKIPQETYDKFLGKFNPHQFDANAWVRMAKGAGMKYLVITSKHHDGFCLWPSELTDYDIASTPYQRDILGELKAACDDHGVEFCLYHSILDWRHPDYLPKLDWEKHRAEGADYNRYVAHLKGQLRELIERYDPGVLWFDGEWDDTWTHEMGKDLYGYVRGLKPDIIINNRVDKGRQGMQGLTKGEQYRGDFGTPEQEIPPTGLPGVDWESCMTMNGHWGYNRHDKNFKSTTDLVRKLIDIASKGGNFLLNVGPTASGEFPQESMDRLAAIGEWMQVNGESIYGTTASPCEQPAWGRLTRKDERLFLHIFDWPADGKLVVPVAAEVVACRLLTDEAQTFRVTKDQRGLIVHLNGEPSDSIATVLELTCQNTPVAID